LRKKRKSKRKKKKVKGGYWKKRLRWKDKRK